MKMFCRREQLRLRFKMCTDRNAALAYDGISSGNELRSITFSIRLNKSSIRPILGTTLPSYVIKGNITYFIQFVFPLSVSSVIP